MSLFPHETIPILHRNLPVLVFEHRNDRNGDGCAFHWHEELEFYYVHSGGVLLDCAGVQQWLYPGDVGFVSSCVPHRGARFLDGTQHDIIQIHPDVLRGETEMALGRSYESLLLELLPGLPAFFHDKRLSEQFRELSEEWKQCRPGMELAVKACVFRIFVYLLRCAPVQPSGEPGSFEHSSLDHVKKVLLYLASHYDRPEETSLPVVASRFGLSVPYLCRIFRKHTGCTVTNYLNRMRCTRAAALIRSGVPLMDAGRQVGIEDYNYFSRLFKKTVGQSPGEFRPEKNSKKIEKSS